jgi:hypothetical protein
MDPEEVRQHQTTTQQLHDLSAVIDRSSTAMQQRMQQMDQLLSSPNEIQYPEPVQNILREFSGTMWPLLEQDRRISALDVKLQSLASRLEAHRQSLASSAATKQHATKNVS